MTPPAAFGTIGWFDLTVPDAGAVKDFYSKVCGWSANEVDMGGYADYDMNAADGKTVAGICNKRGPNADVPSQWLMYVRVADLKRSLDEVCAGGGTVVRDATSIGAYGVMAVVRDPAGAVIALIQPGT